MFNVKALKQQKTAGNYKWIALSNTTLGGLMAAINLSSVTIALPVIFRGIGLDPLGAGNFVYLLWVLMGYSLVMAVLVVTLGRLGDMFGRVKMYNLGFVIFTVSSILLSITWSTGPAGAMEIIIFRFVQAIGGAMLTANSVAILTDAFPVNQRGLAIGINMISYLAGSFIGLIAGGILAEIHWRWVFLVNVPFGIGGTIWSYLMLRETGVRGTVKIDWVGNLTFAAGLIMLLVGVNYGIQPSATSSMSWTTPFVLSMIIGGILLLCLFIWIERYVAVPFFRLSLFRVRAFTFGNLASLLSAIGTGGLQFMLIIWLQGIWLPLHGYDFEITPLWAGIYLVPMTAGFLLSGPISGILSDRFGQRLFITAGLTVSTISLVLLLVLPVNFPYWAFALILFLNGIGSGLFAAPNGAAVMNSVPADCRGVAAGMRSAFWNVGAPISIGVFFSLMIVGLNATVPGAMYNGLVQNGVSTSVAGELAKLPAVGYLFAAFLGFNPLGTLLGPDVLGSLPAGTAANLTSRSFFPELIMDPFQHGMSVVLTFSVIIFVIAIVISLLRGGKEKEIRP